MKMRQAILLPGISFSRGFIAACLGAALIFASGLTAVQAGLTASVDGNGVLTITLSGDDDALVVCDNGQIQVNGQDPDSGPAGCAGITSILVNGGPGDNEINLGAVTRAAFPALGAIRADAGAGSDTITASEFSDTLLAGAGDDVLIGAQAGDVVDAGPGRNLSMEATVPLGLGPSVPFQAAASAPGPAPLAPALSNSLEGPDFDTNATHTSSFFIPPDPIAAAGPDYVVSVVNVTIEWEPKSGSGPTNSQSLQNFFSPLTPLTFTFDPKVIYDQFENRFVVVTLERTGPPNRTSRILLAVSDGADPNGAWYYQAIDAKMTIGSGGTDYWVDYPGFAVDEEAIYVTGNMFSFTNNAYGGTRLWIVDKGVGAGGLYDSSGGSAVSVSNPYAGGGTATTTQPAHIFGAAQANVGTFLVSYSGLSDGINEYIQVVRVDTPLTTPAFVRQDVNIGNVDNAGAGMPDAPQLGTTALIETNDRRALHAVWRDDALWLVATIVPGSGTDSGQATAHWVQLDTSTLTAISLTDQGNIGGEDIAAGTYTFFPSIAVDPCGNMAVGFSASAPTIYPGAYYTGRYSGDAAGTVQSTETLAAGVDYYVRTFGGSRNRWGDYSGIALDPSSEAAFWVFNEYALTRGTVLSQYPTQDGRWGTRYGAFTFNTNGFDFGDLPSGYALTNRADDGARHCIGTLFLGSAIDADGDGQESSDASGDGADEDGVARDMTDPWLNGASVDITFAISGTGTADVGLWIDWNGNGSFDPASDFYPFTGLSTGGTVTETITVAASGTYTVGDTVNVRVRVFPDGGAPGGGLTPDDFAGSAANGEVEDYRWTFSPTAVTLRSAGSARSPLPLLATVFGLAGLVTLLVLWRYGRSDRRLA